MITFTCNNFKGHYPVGTSLVVTADDVWTAIVLVEKALKEAGLEQSIAPDQLIPLPTHHRYLRILRDGNY